MVEVVSEKLTERERDCLKHFCQAREGGLSFAQYCRSSGLKASEWHAVRNPTSSRIDGQSLAQLVDGPPKITRWRSPQLPRPRRSRPSPAPYLALTEWV
jgi:hypothetical protein